MAIEIAKDIPSGIATINRQSERMPILIVSKRVSFEKNYLSPLKLMCREL